LRITTDATGAAAVDGAQFDQGYRVAWSLIASVGVHLYVDDVCVLVTIMLHHIIVYFSSHSVILSAFSVTHDFNAPFHGALSIDGRYRIDFNVVFGGDFDE
jgi:hypothetical protein